MAPDLPYYRIDITKAEETFKKIVKISSDIIILTAAMTDVDQCEVNKGLEKKINVEGTKNVIGACKKTNSKLIFISTDFVFDGTKKEGLYKEIDLPNPLSYYAKTKYEAEQAIIKSEIDYLICRTAILYGWNAEKLNFITWVLNKLQQNQKISIVTNQVNSPKFVRNLAEIILKLREKDANGIFHTAGDIVLNRYEMALKCAKIFDYDEKLINPIENIEQKAIRPKNAGLDISKLKNLISAELKILNLEEGLNYMKKNRASHNYF
ncbi:MAG: SDR family oxidoreductase [Promethearchaeota archaeon]